MIALRRISLHCEKYVTTSAPRKNGEMGRLVYTVTELQLNRTGKIVFQKRQQNRKPVFQKKKKKKD